MEPKEFELEFPRGDTCPVSFELTDADGNELSSEDLEVTFTAKKNYNTEEIVFQKKLSEGNIVLEGKNGHLVIEHKDTAELKYGSYVYDIEFRSGDYYKTLVIGTFTLTNESTF